MGHMKRARRVACADFVWRRGRQVGSGAVPADASAAIHVSRSACRWSANSAAVTARDPQAAGSLWHSTRRNLPQAARHLAHYLYLSGRDGALQGRRLMARVSALKLTHSSHARVKGQCEDGISYHPPVDEVEEGGRQRGVWGTRGAKDRR